MMKFTKAAILAVGLAASAQGASALPIVNGEINFSGVGGLSGTAGNLLPLTIVNPLTFLAIATGSFSVFPVLPVIQPVSLTGFTNLNTPVVIFITSTSGITAAFTATTFISSSVSNSSYSELIGGILSETGYQSAFEVLDLTSVANSTTFTADVFAASGPEPDSLVLLGTGIISAAGMFARRRKLAA